MTKRKWVLRVVIFSALRRQFKKSPMYAAVMKRIKVEIRISGKTKDNIRRVKYRCEICGELFDHKPGNYNIDVHHIHEVVPIEGLPIRDGEPDYHVYAMRLFCDPSQLLGICKGCHKAITKEQAKERRGKRKDVKSKQRTTKEPVSNNRGRKRERTKTATKRSPNKPGRKVGRHKNTRTISGHGFW